MLMMIGAVPVEIWPLNATEYSSQDAGRFAEKSVIGRRPILEAVGEGEGTLNVTCKVFPQKLGGLDHIDVLQNQRAAQDAMPVMRGDGVPLGFMVITDIKVRHEHLDENGIGRVVTCEISLKKSDPPGAAGIFSMLAGLFS